MSRKFPCFYKKRTFAGYNRVRKAFVRVLQEGYSRNDLADIRCVVWEKVRLNIINREKPDATNKTVCLNFAPMKYNE